MAADGDSVMQRAPDHPRRPRRRTRIGPVCLLLLAVIGSLTARTTDEAAASAGEEASFVASLNSVRAGVGLPALTVNSQLANLSRAHAQVMADAGEIFHADPISAGYGGAWSKIGENVGVGANVSVLVDAFVASPGHYANIVDPSFTEVGVGVVWKDGALYTTHRFLQVPGSTTTTTTAAPPASTTTSPPAPTTTTSATPTTAAPPTTAPPTPIPTSTPPTTLPPLAPPSIAAARVVTLLEMVELVGT